MCKCLLDRQRVTRARLKFEQLDSTTRNCHKSHLCICIRCGSLGARQNDRDGDSNKARERQTEKDKDRGRQIEIDRAQQCFKTCSA